MQRILISLTLALGCAVLGAQEPPEEGTAPSGEAPQVFEARTGAFEFIAADNASLQIARKIGAQVIRVCDQLLTPPTERLPILTVKLAPDGMGNLEGQSHLLFEDVAGDYGVAVAWNENLPAALFMEVLTESYIRQLVYTISDRKRAEETPPWLIAGASLQVQVAFRPSLIEYLQELGRDYEMVSLEDLLSKKSLGELTPQDRIAAFWFIELVTRQLDKPKRIRNYFDTIVAGNLAIETLVQQAETIGDFPNGVEGWWVIGFQDLVHREAGIVLPLSRSAKQLFFLNRFELIDNGRPLLTTAPGLWEFRKSPAVRQSLTDRLVEIETILPRVNPVFYNSFRSLALVFESLLSDDRESFEQNIAEFEDELQISANLAREVMILTEDPEAELPEGETGETVL